jgi:hypothetical protein
VTPARDIRRLVCALLVAGLWALSLAWAPGLVRLSEERSATAIGQAEAGHMLPATETPKIAAPERRASVELDADLEPARTIAVRSFAELAVVVSDHDTAPEHNTYARLARGPPIRA